MQNKLFTTRVKIEILEKKLSAENSWISEYKPWKEIWAAISLKNISRKGALYIFAVKWRGDFPREFRAIINDRIFMPTQTPASEISEDLILFHATTI
ncbi:MAG: hypothetical protein LBJ96_00680 [Holosporaceae bacterium]|jgi:hypothetical protein|nr:hypothetical protein [Holosporaceae bacterium]